MPTPQAAALPRRRAVGATLLVFGAVIVGCTQPLTLAPNDADRVLAHRTLEAPNPAENGTSRVRKLYYGSGTDRRRPEYRDSVTYKTATVDASPFARMEPATARSRKQYWGFDNTRFPRNARVWYPEGDGPFPLVLVVHGNHNMQEFSDPGYQWLGEWLASRGYILASIDENFLNGGLRGENDARGWMLLKHLELFRAFNRDSSAGPLYHKVDMSRIVLMGHSRGGEAVAIAGAFNRLPNYPDDATIPFDFNFDIRGLVAIAPVDGQYRPTDQPTPLADINYLVLHGSHDGDVSSFMGLTQYNRIRFTNPGDTFKAAIWMYRANHGQWNTVWANRDNGRFSGRSLQLAALIPGEQQRQFGRVAIGAFLETTLRGSNAYRPFFRDHRTAGDWLPPTMYLQRYADANTHLLAGYDEDVDVTTGSTPGVRIAAESLSTWKELDVPARSRAPTFRSNAVTLGWNNTPVGRDTMNPRTPPRYTITLSDSLRAAWQPGSSSALLLTVGVTDIKPGARKVSRDTSAKPGSSQPSPKSSSKPASRSAARRPDAAKRPTHADSLPPDFSIELEDSAGHIARIALSDAGPVRRPLDSFIYRRRGRDKSTFPTLAEQVMNSYVVPMSAFTGVNNAFNPRLLKAVRFVFDRVRAGTVLVDDVGLTVLR